MSNSIDDASSPNPNILCRLTTKEGIKLRTVFESITPLLCEGHIIFNRNGMTLRSANDICACDLSLPKEGKLGCVENYYFNSPKPLSCAIAFESMQIGLQTLVGPSDIVILRVTRDGYYAQKPYIILTITHPSGSYIHDSRIHLLCLEKIGASLPSMHFERVVSLSSNLFLKILRSNIKKGSAVRIYTTRESNKNYICFSVDDDQSKGLSRVFFDNIGDNKITPCLKKELYSLRYLMLISKSANLSSVVRIYLKVNSVLGIGMNVGSIGRIFFCLSPNLATSTHDVISYPDVNIIESEEFKKEIFKRKKKRRTKST